MNPNVKPKGASDDPREAPESGGPGEAGRLHGRDVSRTDEKQSPQSGGDEPMPGRTDQKGNEGRIGEDLESGRQDAT
jgi:hypothetical protein